MGPPAIVGGCCLRLQRASGHPALERIEAEARDVDAVRRRWGELFVPVVVEDGPVRVVRRVVATERIHRFWKQGVRRRTGRSRVAVALRYVLVRLWQ